MAFKIDDLVLETATGPGTGTFPLNGAPTNRRSFVTGIGSGNATAYMATDGTNSEWGLGTVTSGSPNTLSRDTVLGNTAGTAPAKINFAGTVTIFCSLLSDLVLVLQAKPVSGDVGRLVHLALSGEGLELGPSLIGVTFEWTGASLPAKCVWPNGQNLSRTAYPELNALYLAAGYPFGAGDGSSTFGVPDLRGRVTVGRDDMGGSAASRVTSAGSGITGTALGASGGAQSKTLAMANLPASSVAITGTAGASGSLNLSVFANTQGNINNTGGTTYATTAGNGNTEISPIGSNLGNHTHGVTGNTAPLGSGTAFGVMPPAFVLNRVLYAGR